MPNQGPSTDHGSHARHMEIARHAMDKRQGEAKEAFNKAAAAEKVADDQKQAAQDQRLQSQQIAKHTNAPGLHPKGPLRDAGARDAHKSDMAKDDANAKAKNDRMRDIYAEAQKDRQNQQNMSKSKDNDRDRD